MRDFYPSPKSTQLSEGVVEHMALSLLWKGVDVLEEMKAL